MVSELLVIVAASGFYLYILRTQEDISLIVVFVLLYGHLYPDLKVNSIHSIASGGGNQYLNLNYNQT